MPKTRGRMVDVTRVIGDRFVDRRCPSLDVSLLALQIVDGGVQSARINQWPIWRCIADKGAGHFALGDAPAGAPLEQRGGAEGPASPG